VLSEVEPDFRRFGERIQKELEALGDECEASPPYLVQMNAWGEKVDQVGKLRIIIKTFKSLRLAKSVRLVN
jgi:hypothetical protein